MSDLRNRIEPTFGDESVNKSTITEDMNVFPGGERRVPMTERPFMRFLQAIKPKLVRWDDRVIKAQDDLEALEEEQVEQAGLAADAAYDEAIKEPKKKLDEAQAAFDVAKADSRQARKLAKQAYDEAYSVALDDTVENERARLQQALRDAQEAAKDNKGVGKKAGADLAAETEGLEGDDLREKLKARREAMQAELKSKSAAVIKAENELQEFEDEHAQDITFAEQFAKAKAEEKRKAIADARSKAQDELTSAKQTFKTAEADAVTTAAEAGRAKAAEYDASIASLSDSVDTVKEIVADEMKAETAAAIEGVKAPVAEWFSMKLSQTAQLAERAVNAAKGAVVGIVRGAVDGALGETYFGQKNKAARVAKVFDEAPGEVINKYGEFDRQAAADIQGKLLAVAAAAPDTDISAITSYQDLHQTMQDVGVTQRDLYAAGKALDRGDMPAGFPKTGDIALQFGLVDKNTSEALLAARAGQQVRKLADDIDHWGRDGAEPQDAQSVIDSIPAEPYAPENSSSVPAAIEISDNRTAADAAVGLAKVVKAMADIDPGLTKSLGFSQIAADLKGLGNEAITNAQNHLSVTGSDAARDVGRLADRKHNGVNAGVTNRLEQFIAVNIQTMVYDNKMTKEQGQLLGGYAYRKLGELGELVEGRQRRKDMARGPEQAPAPAPTN